MHNYIIKLFVVFLLGWAVPQYASGQEQANKHFAAGNAHYARGQYQQAIQAYDMVLKEGYRSAALYYNLGNAYYKLDEIPEAILNYEKAYKLAPGDEDIALNIQLANQKIKDKIDAVPELFLYQWWKSVLLFFSADTLGVFSIVGLLLGFSALIVYLFSMAIQVKRYSFYTGLVLLGLGLMAGLLAHLQSGYLNSTREAVVFRGTVNVKSGPKTSLKTLFMVHEGLKVSIKEKESGWAKVELPNGNVGWIQLSDVKEI